MSYNMVLRVYRQISKEVPPLLLNDCLFRTNESNLPVERAPEQLRQDHRTPPQFMRSTQANLQPLSRTYKATQANPEPLSWLSPRNFCMSSSDHGSAPAGLLRVHTYRRLCSLLILISLS
jgi:hypothetical protein